MQNLLPHDKTRFEQNTYTHDITQQLITSVFFYSRDPFGPNSKAHTAGIPRDDNESHWLDRERSGFDYNPKKLAHPFIFQVALMSSYALHRPFHKVPDSPGTISWNFHHVGLSVKACDVGSRLLRLFLVSTLCWWVVFCFGVCVCSLFCCALVPW